MRLGRVLEAGMVVMVVMVAQLAPVEACPRPTHNHPEWRATAASMKSKAGQEVPIKCPPNGHLFSVWGNNPYTSDSSICSAAVHAGLITVKQGGLVYIKVQFEEKNYKGNYRNGVSSRSYTIRIGKFHFTKARQDLPGQKRPPPRPEDTTWGTTASRFTDRHGERIKLICPRGGSAKSVWGNNPYTNDSSICSAAVHAGLITLERGGSVTIKMAAGQDSYGGNYRNGVTSRSYGKWGTSFIFPRAQLKLSGQTKPAPDPRKISWVSSAGKYKGRKGEFIELICPRGGRARSVWGNNPYTDDTSICSAAVHAGLITLERGGSVTIKMAAGQKAYTGTTRNGVTSRDYGSWRSSFIFPQAARNLSGKTMAEKDPYSR